MSEDKYLKEPVKYCIYKGMGGKNGAAQFQLIRFSPRREYNGKAKPQGGVLLEMAPTSGKNLYDWSKKVSFWMTPEDCAAFLIFKTMTSDDPNNKGIFHKHGDVNKKLNICKGNIRDGLPTWMLSLRSGEQVAVPISAVEMTVLSKLLEAAIPAMLGWHTEES